MAHSRGVNSETISHHYYQWYVTSRLLDGRQRRHEGAPTDLHKERGARWRMATPHCGCLRPSPRILDQRPARRRCRLIGAAALERPADDGGGGLIVRLEANTKREREPQRGGAVVITPKWWR